MRADNFSGLGWNHLYVSFHYTMGHFEGTRFEGTGSGRRGMALGRLKLDAGGDFFEFVLEFTKLRGQRAACLT